MSQSIPRVPDDQQSVAPSRRRSARVRRVGAHWAGKRSASSSLGVEAVLTHGPVGHVVVEPVDVGWLDAPGEVRASRVGAAGHDEHLGDEVIDHDFSTGVRCDIGDQLANAGEIGQVSIAGRQARAKQVGVNTLDSEPGRQLPGVENGSIESFNG